MFESNDLLRFFFATEKRKVRIQGFVFPTELSGQEASVPKFAGLIQGPGGGPSLPSAARRRGVLHSLKACLKGAGTGGQDLSKGGSS